MKPRTRSTYPDKMKLIDGTERPAHEIPGRMFIGTCRVCKMGFFWDPETTAGKHNEPGCPFCQRPIRKTTKLSTLKFRKIVRMRTAV